MHVLHVIQDLGVGGTERLLQTLLPALRDKDVESSVLCLTTGGIVAEELEADGFDVRVEGIASYWNPFQLAHLRRAVSHCGPALVHAHGSFANIAAGFAASGSGFPSFFTHHHTMWVDEWPRRQRWAERRSSARARRVICISDAVKESVVEAGIATPSSTAVVYNGIDLTRFSPSQRPGRGKILCVGSLAPHKGHHVLLDALPAVLASVPDALVTLAGEGGEQEALSERATTLGVKEQVEFAGLVSDVRPLLEEADLMVLPSVMREGLGIAILEAMAAGVPVVASRCGGIPEVIEDGRTGRLVEPGDSDGLAETMIDVLLDPEMAMRLAGEARAAVAERFDIRVAAEQLKELYAEAAGA